MCPFPDRNLQQRELLPTFTAFPFNRSEAVGPLVEPLRGKDSKIWNPKRKMPGIYVRPGRQMLLNAVLGMDFGNIIRL